MSRKKRGVWGIVAVLGLLIATEIGLNVRSGPSATVQIDNLGHEPIEGLEVSCGSHHEGPARVEAGGSIRFEMSGTRARTLRITFHQRGTPLTSFEHPGFDPSLLREEGSRLILQIRPHEIIRFQDEAEPRTAWGRFRHYVRFKAWDSLTKEYVPY